MTDQERLEALLVDLRREFPGFRLVNKADAPLQRVIARVLAILTPGGRRGYLDDFVTTMGETIYVNRGWQARSAADRYVTLRHERVHLRQFRRWGLVPMALAYLFLPLPIGLAWCRARLEQAAYAEGLRALAELRGADAVAMDPELRAHVIAQFTGPSYGWMWPFPRAIARWYDRVAAGLVGDFLC